MGQERGRVHVPSQRAKTRQGLTQLVAVRCVRGDLPAQLAEEAVDLVELGKLLVGRGWRDRPVRDAQHLVVRQIGIPDGADDRSQRVDAEAADLAEHPHQPQAVHVEVGVRGLVGRGCLTRGEQALPEVVLDGRDRNPGGSAVPAAALLMPAGFFFSSMGQDVTRPNRFIVLLYIGAASLAAGLLALGVGLLRA